MSTRGTLFSEADGWSLFEDMNYQDGEIFLAIEKSIEPVKILKYDYEQLIIKIPKEIWNKMIALGERKETIIG